jgi:hypothetical protein
MDRGLLAVMAISDGSCLTVLAASSCDVGVVAYGMTVLVTRAGDVLTPASRPSSKPPSAMSTQHPPWRPVKDRWSSSVPDRQEANRSRARQRDRPAT